MAEQVPGGFDHIQILMAYPYEFDSPAMSAFCGPSPVGEQWSQTFQDENYFLATADGPDPGDDAIHFAVWIAGDPQVDRPAFHYQAYRGGFLVDNADMICWGPGELDWMVAPGTWPLRSPIPPYLPGDANFDGDVNVGDLGILGGNYGSSGRTWREGDFNGDQIVNVGDLGILGFNYGTSINPQGGGHVPEPSTIVLMGLGIAAAVRKGRRTR